MQAVVRDEAGDSDATGSDEGFPPWAAGTQDAAVPDGCESSSIGYCVQSTFSDSSMLSSFAIRSTTSI